MEAAKHQPWMKWYPADWRADPRLRMCSLAARGLWIELIGYMHESPRYGYLIVADTSPTNQQIAMMVGDTVAAVRRYLGELRAAGVFSEEEGTVYSRRMVRDNAKALRDRTNGKGGGNPNLLSPLNPNEAEGVNPPDKATRGHASATQKPEARSQKDPQPQRSESASRSPRGSPVAGREFAFAGAKIRLTQRDFDNWKSSFSAIPDLTAELEAIDAKLVDEGFDGKWFGRVSAWLRSRHEALLRQAGTGSKAYRNGENMQHQPNGGYAYAPESPEHWRDRLRAHYGSDRRNRWPDEAWGPPPGKYGCRVPPDVLAEFEESRTDE